MSKPTDEIIDITVTVDTDNLNDQNKNEKIVFSDGLGGPPEKPGEPENYQIEVENNQIVTWTAKLKNPGNTAIFFQNVKHEKGEHIMKEIKRGNGHNIYTAKVKYDKAVKKGDDVTENYSITIGLKGYEGIAGSNENGPIVYLGKTVAYMDSYAKDVWYIVKDAPFEIEGIAGYNKNGAIIYAGNRVAYIDDYKNGDWIEIAQAPFTIEGIAGSNNTKGILVYSGNRVAYIRYNTASVWTETAPAPFNIEGITGDVSGGPIIYAGSGLAYMNEMETNGGWNPIFDAPFEIEGIHGSYQKGIVIYAGDQVAYATQINTGTSFITVGAAPFIIEGIAGNGSNGPIIFSGPQVKYMSDYSVDQWNDVSPMPFDTQSFTIDPKLKLIERVR